MAARTLGAVLVGLLVFAVLVTGVVLVLGGRAGEVELVLAAVLGAVLGVLTGRKVLRGGQRP